MKTVIEVNNMRLILGRRTILNIPSFSLQEHEAISLMGPNGAGKSSLMLAMAALLPPTAGTIAYFGNPAQEYAPHDLRRRMAMVFQKPLMTDVSVMETLELGLKFRGISHKERAKRVRPWMEKMKLSHLAKQRARSLSGGEAQRLAIAQALVVEPEIIFLDEPFANLDKEIRDELRDDIARFLRERNITTVMVTHHKQEALMLTDVIYHMEDGEIIGREFVAETTHKIGKE